MTGWPTRSRPMRRPFCRGAGAHRCDRGTGGSAGAETAERVADALERADRFRAILSDIEALRDYVAEADFGHFEKIEELRTTLVARIGDVSASFDQRITVAVSDLAALAQRTTVLEASTEELKATITSVELASVSRDEALASRIDLLSVGTDNQFDPTKLWGFDTSVAGWTSSLGVSVSNGFLRVGNGSAPQVLSPTGLSVQTNTDRQVRARLRKVGDPVWLGQIWWRSSTQSFDVARSFAVDEPLFDPNGEANITWSMPWTGTIDQIRIDLSANQTATDGFEIDGSRSDLHRPAHRVRSCSLNSRRVPAATRPMHNPSRRFRRCCRPRMARSTRWRRACLRSPLTFRHWKMDWTRKLRR